MAGDAGSLFAQRLLGDLNNNLLARLQNLGNQLGLARRLTPLLRTAHIALRAAIPAASAHGSLKARSLRFGDARSQGAFRSSRSFRIPDFAEPGWSLGMEFV